MRIADVATDGEQGDASGGSGELCVRHRARKDGDLGHDDAAPERAVAAFARILMVGFGIVAILACKGFAAVILRRSCLNILGWDAAVTTRAGLSREHGEHDHRGHDQDGENGLHSQSVLPNSPRESRNAQIQHGAPVPGIRSRGWPPLTQYSRLSEAPHFTPNFVGHGSWLACSRSTNLGDRSATHEGGRH